MTLEPSVSPGVWRIDTAPPGALILSEAAVVARNNGGNVTVGNLAWALQCSQGRARRITEEMVADGRWVPKGSSPTGARCYGEVQP